MFQSLAAFLRVMSSLVFLGLVGAGGWWGYDTYVAKDQLLQRKNQELAHKAREIQDLEQDVASKVQQIDRLNLALRLLKVDRRMAQVAVVDQSFDDKTDPEKATSTRFRFVEVDPSGKPIGQSREYTIEGDLLYVDAWIVKFDDELVQEGDPLRSSSLCLFRRLFGEHQKPSDGYTIDPPFERPEIYGGSDQLSTLEEDAWTYFWEYANDPEKASEAGIRAAHGEAPSMKLLKGNIYNLSLRASDGLSITPEKLPAVVEE